MKKQSVDKYTIKTAISRNSNKDSVQPTVDNRSQINSNCFISQNKSHSTNYLTYFLSSFRRKYHTAN